MKTLALQGIEPNGGGALSSNVSKLGGKEVIRYAELVSGSQVQVRGRFCRKVAFTKPSRGTSEARDEQESTGTLSSRCDCKRCRLMRGAVARKSRKIAFTLAEVLIILGIVGVVASLTIGSVVNNIQKKELQTQFLKTTSQLQQAVKSMEANGESIDPRSYKYWDKGLFYNTFANYIKHIKTCKGNTNVQHPCYNKDKDVYYTPNGNTLSYALLDDGQIVLPDGTLLLFENESHGTSSFKVYIFADLNGINKKPNKLGYDLFAYQLINNQLLPMGSEGTDYVGEQYCSKNSYGMSCTQKALEDKDYFKNLKRNN